MTPLELYRSGELRAAIKALGDELRADPLDIKRRTFLFELLCFAGEYDRAEKQLNVLADTNNQALAGTLLYRSALHAEKTRQEMFSKRELPHVDAAVEPVSGTWNGEPFTDLRDADPRIGANLEVFIAGSYTWIPMHYMRHLEIEKPETLRDLIWARARVETSPAFRLQDLGEVLIPVLAPLSSKHSDESVQLGRTTVWEDATPEDTVDEVLYGQRLMLVDGEEIPILELRSIKWDAPPEESQHAPA
jgi:type VI secretion system protein ImpE